MRFKRNDKSKLYVVVSDVHVPYQHAGHCAAVADLLDDVKPDGFVINGDYLDLIEVSRHASSSVAQLEGLRISKSFDAGNAQLDTWLTAAGPGCADNHFIDGNHEDRLRRWMQAGDNSVWLGDESTDIGNRLNLKDRGFVYHKGYPDAFCRLGKLLVTHGRWTGKYAAATHLDRYGHAIMVGHTHSPQMFYGSALAKQKAGYVLGFLGDQDSIAMKYAPKPNAWCPGFATVQVEPDKTFHVTQIQFARGAFYYAGRRYGVPARR
jgi:predicted phosphodiesterase